MKLKERSRKPVNKLKRRASSTNQDDNWQTVYLHWQSSFNVFQAIICVNHMTSDVPCSQNSGFDHIFTRNVILVNRCKRRYGWPSRLCCFSLYLCWRGIWWGKPVGLMADVFRFKNISQTLKGRVHFARHLL